MPPFREEIEIPRRFVGYGFAQGGYVGGRLAALLDDGSSAEVRLRKPVPLETKVTVESDGRTAKLMTKDDLLAECVAAEFEVRPPALTTYDAAAAAIAIPERIRTFEKQSEAERCFGCGTKPDGLRMRPGPVLDGTVIAGALSVPADLIDEGKIPTEVIWAALDCPSLWCWFFAEEQEDLVGRRIVTGSMAVAIHRHPRWDERLFVESWRASRDGRKVIGAAVLVADSGEIVAEARQVGIVL